MQQADKTLCKQFEIEVWLYISGELDDTRKHCWDSHLKLCKECSNLLASNIETSSFYKDNLEEDINEVVFDKMIEKATAKTTLKGSIKEFLTRSGKTFSFGKVVLGSTLITASLIILFLSQKPLSVKEKPPVPEIKLEWEDTEFSNQLQDVSDAIMVLQNKSKKADVEWSQKVSGLEDLIDSLKTRINN